MSTSSTPGQEPANDIRRSADGWRGCYCPRPDQRVKRAIRELLNEPDPDRRGCVAAWTVFALVVVLMLSGVRW